VSDELRRNPPKFPIDSCRREHRPLLRGYWYWVLALFRRSAAKNLAAIEAIAVYSYQLGSKMEISDKRKEAMLNISIRSFGTAISAVTKTIFAGLILLCGLQSAARADVYTYTGNAFENVTGPYTTIDFVSGSFTLASALGNNLPLANVTPLSYSFNDGVQTISSLIPPGDVTFQISTNASGNIDGWLINLENPSPYNGISTMTDGDTGTVGGSYGSNAPYVNSGSQWKVSGTSPVPEPNPSWPLFGLLTVVGWAKMRFGRSKRQPE
jgi:hypothetical protein